MSSKCKGGTPPGRIGSRSLRGDREGVASAVGAMLALLVFISLMAVIAGHYVPAWMADNERGHMDQVMGQFGDIKGKVDSVMIAWTVRGGPSGPIYAPIALGSSGIPVLASPTMGILRTVTDSPPAVEISFGDSLVNEENITGGGMLELHCPNRYFVQQWLVYENGAIILRQDDGQVMLAHPNLSILTDGVTGREVGFTLINLEGTGETVSGSHSTGVNLEMTSFSTETRDLLGNDWTLTLTTGYGSAWRSYFEEILAQQDMREDNAETRDYIITETPGDPGTSMVKLTLTIHDVNRLTLDRASLRITI